MTTDLDMLFYVVSGGIKVTVEHSINALLYNGEISQELYDKFQKKMYIFGNSFLYKDTAYDYSRPIIHTLNKKEFIYGQGKEFKKNMIIVGDNLDDVKMVDYSKHDLIFGVGYLNENEDKLLDNYLKIYDLVIVGDGTFHPINAFLNKAFNMNKDSKFDKSKKKYQDYYTMKKIMGWRKNVGKKNIWRTKILINLFNFQLSY